MKKLHTLLLLAFSAFAWAGGIDFSTIEKDLTGAGLQGWIHGAAHDFHEYVFTYRDPKDFFTHVEMSLVPADAAIAAELKKLQRHDEVIIQGSFLKNPSAQKHIWVEKIKVATPYDSGISVPAHTREAKLPSDLVGKDTLLATVHAIAADGEILVLEYKDAVVPVFVKDKTQSKDLFRGDKIKLHYVLQKSPKSTMHLQLDPKASPAIEVLEKIVDRHGKPLVLEGNLVFFPKSPQLLFGVYALQLVDSNGLKLNFTLVNFDDPDVFSEIRAKLEKLWQANETTAEDGRNCFINKAIRIRATGKGNVVSPSQANPQILLDGPDSIDVLKP